MQPKPVRRYNRLANVTRLTCSTWSSAQQYSIFGTATYMKSSNVKKKDRKYYNQGEIMKTVVKGF